MSKRRKADVEHFLKRVKFDENGEAIIDPELRRELLEALNEPTTREIDYNEIVEELYSSLYPNYINISQDLREDIKQMFSELQEAYNVPDVQLDARMEIIMTVLQQIAEATPSLYEVEIATPSLYEVSIPRHLIVSLHAAWH